MTINKLIKLLTSIRDKEGNIIVCVSDDMMRRELPPKLRVDKLPYGSGSRKMVVL